MFFRGGAVADESEVRGDPGEIKRCEGPEKVSAINGAETEGENEVVDDAGPEIVGHAESLGRRESESFEAEERVRREDEGPDLVEVGVGETKGFEHGCDVGRLGDGGGECDGLEGLDGARSLPEGSLGVDVGEERRGDLSEEGVDVESGGLRQRARADVDLGDAAVGDGRFVERPEDCVVLAAGGESLGDGGESLGHAEGETDVDGERIAGARAEEGARYGIEDGGVDKTLAGAEIIVAEGEVGEERGFGEGADGFGVDGLGFGTKQNAGGGVAFLRELPCVEVVGCGEDPGVG